MHINVFILSIIVYIYQLRIGTKSAFEFHNYRSVLPYLGLHNVHPLLALKISRKKLVRVYNVHGLLKKIVVGSVRIKYQSYIFFSPLSMFHLLGEF
jgi:uncharacterized iron-regulated protein